jgi:purine-binding chemotaxis protein CheW
MNNKVDDTKQASQDAGRQYLSFVMEQEEYAVSILSVREIRGWEPVTPIPNTPEYVKGFINLRGRVVPIIDLRQRFNLPLKEYSRTTVVIILNVDETDNNSELVGIIVDAVSEVYDIKQGDIRSAPKLGGHIETRYIKGIAEIGDKNIILTDVMSLLDAEELIKATALA